MELNHKMQFTTFDFNDLTHANKYFLIKFVTFLKVWRPKNKNKTIRSLDNP